MASWEEFAALADNYNNGLARWSRAYYDLEARFYQVRDERDAAQKSVTKLTSRLSQMNAHAAGLAAQVNALHDALYKAVPSHPLFQQNPKGQKWPGGKFAGKVVSNIGLEYIRGFEKTLIEMGADPKNPEWYI